MVDVDHFRCFNLMRMSAYYLELLVFSFNSNYLLFLILQ